MTGAARILYIDDDEGLRRLTSRALQSRGYVVELAGGGKEGVALARSGAFDLVAVDHYMPGHDGLATLAELREMPVPPPVIYVTGSEESSVAVAALKAGAIDYVVKTADEGFFDLLARAIEHALAAVRLEREKEQAEAELRRSNARLQTMLREVNHRVANSLQIVTAFVRLQARNLPDEASRAALEDTERRITAIAQVHRRLYTSEDVETVAMDEYLPTLIDEIERTWSTPDRPRLLRVSAEPIRLLTDKAVSLGIIVNELVSNACKYAYGPDQAGEVRIALLRDGEDAYLLRVEDDGCGMPSDGAIKGTGLGSKLISSMASTLGSSIRYGHKTNGTRVELSGAC